MPQPKGSNGMSLEGLIDHVVLAELDIAFDVETLADGLRVFAEEMVRMHASSRVMAAAYRQMQAALTSMTGSLEARHQRVTDARRRTDPPAVGVVA